MRLCLIVFFAVLVTSYNAAALMNEKEMPPLHHVVDVTVPESMNVPDAFPLNEHNRIDCKTCHGVKEIEDIPLDEVDKESDDFFHQGPYARLTDFCFRCHDSKEHQRANIHQQLDEQGELKKEQCEFCHLEAPDPEKTDDRETLEYRLPPQKLCLGCHLKTPHLNAMNHQVEVDDEMLKRIEQAEKQHQIILPLDDKRVICVTCHSPHEKGVIDIDRAAGKQVADRGLAEGVGYTEHPWNSVVMEDKKKRLEQLAQETGVQLTLAYQRLSYEVLLRLPARDGSLCLACHEFDR